MVALKLRDQAFEMYRCDRNVSLGVNLPNLARVFKMGGNEDSVKLSANDEGADVVEIALESTDGDRVCTFDLKLMDIDSDQL